VRDARLFARLRANSTEAPNGCWIWTKSYRTDGYGQINVNRKPVAAHRAMWLAMHGEWFERKEDKLVCHTCDDRRCINPDHLWIGTASQNNADRDIKGRNAWSNKTVCKNGHAFTPENTRQTLKQRFCRTCHRLANERLKKRKRADAASRRSALCA
jgi:hypothetical protein